MSSSALTAETKQIRHGEEGTVLSYLPTRPSIEKIEKQGIFESNLSTFVDSNSDSLSPNGLATPMSTRGLSPGPFKPPRTQRDSGFRIWYMSIWRKNQALILMFVAQLFGALMNLTARLLEVEENSLHPMQLLFARMTITLLGSTCYLWWKKVPHGMLGRKEIRWLLVTRGLCGFFGIYGMWYSVKYIPLAEATVITFLAPNIAGYICHVLIHEPFTRKEQIASFIALGGVILITRPVSLFSGTPSSTTGSIEAEVIANVTAVETSQYPGSNHVTTSAERLGAIGMALLGVLGGAGAFTSLRWIGKRAHPLTSINYFSAWCVVVSTVTLTLAPALDYGQPELRLELPHSLRQWAFLIFIGVCGLVMQVLMTAALAAEKSNRATAMTYTHMLFAAAFDRWIFGQVMGWMSLAGCGLIVGSALWVVFTKKEKTREEARDGSDVERGAVAAAMAAAAPVDSESAPMLSEDTDVNAEEGEGVLLRRL
ncbi:slightly ste11-like protein [Hypoxylon texense]